MSDDDYDKYFIVNTDPASKPGSHWVAVYTGDSPEFFDSLGQSPSTVWERISVISASTRIAIYL